MTPIVGWLANKPERLENPLLPTQLGVKDFKTATSLKGLKNCNMSGKEIEATTLYSQSIDNPFNTVLEMAHIKVQKEA